MGNIIEKITPNYQCKQLNSYSRETIPNFKFERYVQTSSSSLITYLYRHQFTDELYASTRYPFDMPINSSQSHKLLKPLFFWNDLVDIYGNDPILYYDQSIYEDKIYVYG